MLYFNFPSFDKLNHVLPENKKLCCHLCSVDRPSLLVKKCVHTPWFSYSYTTNFCVFCADILSNDFCKSHRCYLCFMVVNKNSKTIKCRGCKKHVCGLCSVLDDTEVFSTCIVCKHTKIQLKNLIKNLQKIIK